MAIIELATRFRHVFVQGIEYTQQRVAVIESSTKVLEEELSPIRKSSCDRCKCQLAGERSGYARTSHVMPKRH